MANSTQVLGGDKWKTVLEELAKEKVGVKVGILEGATTPDGKPIAPYAAFNEFGTEHIPSRPFMRQTVAEKTGEWASSTTSLIKGKSTEKGILKKAVGYMGRQMEADLVEKIKSNIPPANKAATIKRKGPGKPTLFDSGDMLHAISSEVISE